MCSSTCDRPAPSHFPSWMLPAMHHAWAETTGALWSSRTMRVSPLSNVVSLTPGGMAGDRFRAGLIQRHPVALLRFSLGRLRRLGLRRLDGMLAFGQEGLAERLVKIIAMLKVRAAVFVGFCQPLHLDHVKDDFAEVLAGMNPPFFEHRHGHRPELLQRILADAAQQFLARDMANPATGVFADGLLGMVQRFADEQIGVAMVARVFGPHLHKCLFETDFVHITVLLLRQPVPADARCDTI